MIGLSLTIRQRYLFAFAITVFSAVTPALADTWVVHPRAAAPYNQIYDDITKGINTLLPAATIQPTDISSDDFSWSPNENAITLGQSALDALKDKPPPGLWLAGALSELSTDTTLSVDIEVIDVLPDTNTVLRKLAQLSRSTRVVHVVVDSHYGQRRWLNDQTMAKNEYGIDLVIHPAHDGVATARSWFQIIQSLNSQSEAIWLTSDRHLESTGSLDYILRSSWKNSFLVVSSISRHAFKGVSMALVPDWFQYGRFIAQNLLSTTGNLPAGPQIAPDDVYKVVVNMRMLSHIGLSLPASMEKDADIVIKR